MQIIYETENKKISYEQRILVKTSLIKLGVNPKSCGFRAMQQVILFAYKIDLIEINLEYIYRLIVKNNKATSVEALKKLIKRTFDNINTKKLCNNYEDIFEIEFDSEYFTLNNFISDFVDLLSK